MKKVKDLKIPSLNRAYGVALVRVADLKSGEPPCVNGWEFKFELVPSEGKAEAG